MTTQVIFTIDKKLKYEAMRKARSFGLPFSSVLNLATRAFVDGKINVGVVETPTFNEKTAREIRSALSDIAQNKNVSPRFFSAKEASNYLRK
jgi:antitoxin component of RelBE/YafQ-DinJ toxin-antitoxin module